MHTFSTSWIALLEDHPALRQGYRQHIETDSRLRVTYENVCEPQALDELAADPPDLLILGIGLSKRGGLTFLRRVRATVPDVKTLVISPHRSMTYARQVDRLGADGYLCWARAADDLREAANSILAGNTCFPDSGHNPLVRESIRSPVYENAVGEKEH